MKHIKTYDSINEAKFNFTEAEIKNAAETLAKAMAKSDKVKVEVHDFEYDKGRGAGFELSYDGDKYDGGSYYIKPNGDVINAAIKGGTKYGNVKSSEKDYLKYFKANESKVNEAEDYKYKKYVTKAFDKISDAMFEFRNAMGVKQLGQSDPKLKKRLELMQAEIFALRRDMKSEGLTEGTFIDLRIVNENVNDEIESALTNWLNVLADGDPVKITDLYLEDGVLLGTVAEEIKQGHTAIQEYFDMFVTKNPIGSIDTFILQNYGDVCISDGTYTFELDGEEGGRTSVAARYTYVWKKENNKWMIATHHSSVNPK